MLRTYRILLSFENFDISCGPTQPPIKMRMRANFPGVKLHAHEADHPSATCIEFKNEWIYASVPLMCLHDLHRESFTCCVLTAEYSSHEAANACKSKKRVTSVEINDCHILPHLFTNILEMHTGF